MDPPLCTLRGEWCERSLEFDTHITPDDAPARIALHSEVLLMNRIKVLIGPIVIAAMLFGAAPALAAPPSNDTISGATVIAALPFSDTTDTTEATLDADETAAAQPCHDIFGAPATERPVWYKYTAPSDITLLVNTSGSNYTTGIASYNGAPSAATFMSCAPRQLRVPVAAGQTAYLMVFGDTVGSPGGTLRIGVLEAPPVPVVSVTVDPIGSFNPQSGQATMTGTVTCTGVADFVGVNGSVTQAVGRFTINGFFFTSTPFPCDGTTQTWTATTQSSNGKFAGGHATVQADAIACNVSGCGSDHVNVQVRLRRG
jgi:uncharacterized protein DUF6299